MPVRMLTPLCPAGHLPHKGGDRLGASSRSSQMPQIGEAAWREITISRSGRLLPISPLVGEMPGRAEGGTLRHAPDHPGGRT
ncbi:UNVERIFIED_ORG: lytic murein transglycosylase [Rhizobium sophorae]